MISDVTERLASFGYTVTADDTWVLGFISEKVESSIKNDCGVYDTASSSVVIPNELHGIAVDMVCGEFLYLKKQTGQLEGFDLDTALKTVQAGDTTVTFAIGEGSMTPEQRLNSFISYLMTNGKGEFICYRRIKW